MAWENLDSEIEEEFLDAQATVLQQLLHSRALLDTFRAERDAVQASEHWKNLKCNSSKHALRKEQNLRAAHKYLSKNREAHNARQRVRDRARAAAKRAEREGVHVRHEANGLREATTQRRSNPHGRDHTG